MENGEICNTLHLANHRYLKHLTTIKHIQTLPIAIIPTSV